MPTYEYQCSGCGHKFERFQSIKAAPIKQCPACHKNLAKRLIGTGAGLIFKGSGFYITDYRSESYKEKAKSETGGGTTTDSKPAEKTGSAEPKSAKSEPVAAPKTESKPAATKPESKPPKKS